MEGIHDIARRVKDTGNVTIADVMALCDFVLSQPETGGSLAPAAGWIDVPDSSNIAAYAYEARQKLWIAFKSGETWIYNDVPADVATAFGEAESKGRFFAQNIRNNYQGRNSNTPASI